ncbi:DUF3868 domain-containing protein [Proteiniphilum sp.]|uniref:DUF3868 domain-containing protein n=1 Tax=Proteiniphilum sp. TaxID=1926877 RepID=UPI002B204C42|nr:DUF3868 domain-containing protein [Proteiniphilum sp.]MEA4916807.1 DUF3868 domain-containing protein [Proteiniphilum sp.]
MKTKNIIYLIIAFFTVIPGTWAQDARLSDIRIENLSTVKQHDRLSVSFDISLDALQVQNNNMLLLTPVLKSNANNLDNVALEPVVVAGKKRNKALVRKQVLGEKLPFSGEPVAWVVRRNNTSQSVHYTMTVPLRGWMQDASLSLVHEVSGCADCMSLEGEQQLVDNILPAPYQPVYKLTYVMPEAEVKTRSDRHTATFNFVVNRWELRRDFRDNASKLSEVDRIVSDIRNNPDFQITEFAIDGYASPESSVPHNKMLAENRANAFANYLVSRFGIDRNRFSVTGHGEDWEGLRKAVAASNIADRQVVLDIIDNVSNPDARDTELMKLSSGTTYRTLLNDYYPPLRRTEYVVAYTVRGFNVEEAKEIIKSDPRLLSLNEMYLVAQTYPAGSREFKEVFDVATRLYPDSDIAILNSASADIESGSMNAAIERMLKIADNPKVWNNLGVAYARKGDFNKAKEYFTRAAAQGDNDARANLEELHKAIEK